FTSSWASVRRPRSPGFWFRSGFWPWFAVGPPGRIVFPVRSNAALALPEFVIEKARSQALCQALSGLSGREARNGVLRASTNCLRRVYRPASTGELSKGREYTGELSMTSGVGQGAPLALLACHWLK